MNTQRIIMYIVIFLVFLLLLRVVITGECWSNKLEDNEKIIDDNLAAMGGSQKDQLNNEWQAFLDMNGDKIRYIINLMKTNQEYRPFLTCLINQNKLDQLNIDRLIVLLTEQSSSIPQRL